MGQYHKWQRGDVFIGNFPCPRNTHLQDGERPWVILQNDVGNNCSPTTIVAPLTTKMTHTYLPTQVTVSFPPYLRPSVILLEQIRTVDKSKHWRYVCHLSDEVMARVDVAIKASLGVM